MAGFPTDQLLYRIIAGFTAFPVSVLVYIIDHDSIGLLAGAQLIGCVERNHAAHVRDVFAAAGELDIPRGPAAHCLLL